MGSSRHFLRTGALAGAVGVALAAVVLVVFFDAVLSARVRAGSDNALRLSVLLPFVGVGSRYVLARACGLAALSTSAVALGLGLEVGTRRARGRSIATGLRRLHRYCSLAALALIVAHVVLPYTSSVTPFGGWPTAIVPFDQPYGWGARGRVFESFGIVAAYLFVLLGPTYYLLRRHRWLWNGLHGLTAAAYGLAVLHALFLGSDLVLRSASRIALLAVQVPLTVALARRAAATRGRSGGQPLLIAAVALSALVTGLCAAAVAGAGLGAMTV